MPEYDVTIDGVTERLALDGDGVPTLKGKTLQVTPVGAFQFSVLVDGQSFNVVAAKAEHGYVVLIGGYQLEVQVESERKRLLKLLGRTSGKTHHRLEIRAPMPALVLKVEVAAGDEVRAGQGLLVLEAMKMENEMKAHQPGRVKEILVSPGKAVEKGELLMLLE